MTKIIDCTLFFQELDLFEMRLKLLEDVVDIFILCESNLTHSGKQRSYMFADNIERFSKWKNKIVYIQIDQNTNGLKIENVSSYSPDNFSWYLENQHRMGLLLAQDIIPDDCILCLSDMDEIMSPDILIQKEQILQALSQVEALSLVQQFHYYFLNCRCDSGNDLLWNGTVITTGKVFKEKGPQYFRDNRNHFNRIQNGGWHFSYCGSVEAIKAKIESFAHTEFNRPDITSEHNITEAMEKGKDVFNRPGVSYKFHPISDYPEYLQKLMLEYPQFVKQI